MKKFRDFVGIIIIGAIAAGIFGIIHDQISYTISPEYYTKFKFQQFKIPDYFFDRIGVSIVGWNATWRFGLILGTVLALFIRKDLSSHGVLIKAIKSIGVILFLTFVVAIMGLLIGNFFFDPLSPNWIIPDDVIEKGKFLAVGSMHTFSYFGGILGLILGIVYYKKVNSYKTKMGD